ncbi:MAG: hypothetical protein F4X64_13280 [Chloroflexi bacterium]|nr:hypothetical protein [Chloroflexota bacterium]
MGNGKGGSNITVSTVKRIVCLANSRKRGGRCVAGKELLPDDRLGGWIRPVSARHDEEVSPQECCYTDGGDTMPFVFATIGMLSLLPHTFLMPLILSSL